MRLRSLLRRRNEAVSIDAHLVVGLGNPGPGYSRTRHNAGYRVADILAERMDASWKTDRSGRNQVADGRLGPPPSRRLILARPRAYMNESGGSVAAVLRFYKLSLDRLIVVHDELDLPSEVVRVKSGGGDGGHNGLRSLRQALGSGDYVRVRVGVGRPPGRQDPADFVLSNYSAAEEQSLRLQLDRAADAVESLVVEGLDKTQNVFN